MHSNPASTNPASCDHDHNKLVGLDGVIVVEVALDSSKSDVITPAAAIAATGVGGVVEAGVLKVLVAVVADDLIVVNFAVDGVATMVREVVDEMGDSGIVAEIVGDVVSFVTLPVPLAICKSGHTEAAGSATKVEKGVEVIVATSVEGIVVVASASRAETRARPRDAASHLGSQDPQLSRPRA